MERQQLADHARALAAAFGVELVEDLRIKPEDAAASALPLMDPLAQFLLMMGMPEKTVLVHPIRDETTYVVALHELGHCLAPLGMRPERRKLDQRSPEFWLMLLGEEEAAWDWAQHYALEWTGPMQSVKEWAMSTYTNSRRQALAAGEEAGRKKREDAARVVAWNRAHRIDGVGDFLKQVGSRIR